MQGSIQLPGFEQALDAVDSKIATTLQVFCGEPSVAVGAIEFLRAFAGSPLRLEARQNAPNLIAIDAVAAFVRSPAASILDVAARYGILDYSRKLANAIVLDRLSHVESCVVDCALWSLQRAHHGGKNVANVHDRTQGVPSLLI